MAAAWRMCRGLMSHIWLGFSLCGRYQVRF